MAAEGHFYIGSLYVKQSLTYYFVPYRTKEVEKTEIPRNANDCWKCVSAVLYLATFLFWIYTWGVVEFAFSFIQKSNVIKGYLITKEC